MIRYILSLFITLVLLFSLSNNSFSQRIIKQDFVTLVDGTIYKGHLLNDNPNPSSVRIQTVDGNIYAPLKTDISSIDSGIYVTQKGLKPITPFKPYYKGIVEIGCGNIDFFPNQMIFSASTSHGGQLNPYIFLGLGVSVGLEQVFIGDYTSIKGKKEFIPYVPIFMHLRISNENLKVSPFYDLKIGGAMLKNTKSDGSYNGDAEPSLVGNIYSAFTLGVKVRLFKDNFKSLTIGFSWENLEYDLFYYKNGDVSLSLGAKVGITF